MELKNEKFLIDNGVFSNFARISRFNYLFHFSKKLYITEEVLEEIENGIVNHKKLAIIGKYVKNNRLTLISLEKPENLILMDKVVNREKRLGRGEVSSLLCAKEINGYFLSDDESAIKYAKRIGVKVFNKDEFRATLFILKNLTERKIITGKEKQLIPALLRKENFEVGIKEL